MKELIYAINELRKYGVETDYKPIVLSSENADKDFREIFNYFVPNYIHLPEYDKIISWLKNNEGKGLALFGSTGQGKSVFLKSVLPNLFFLKYNKILNVINAYELTRNYVVGRIVVIDEIGNEPNFIDYGSKVNLIGQIIDKCEEKKSLLVIAGNITAKEFMNRYGKPIFDRLVSMAKIVNFNGKTLRR